MVINMGSIKKQGISWLAVQLFVPQEVLCSMELIKHCAETNQCFQLYLSSKHCLPLVHTL
jgi:hypothetical protein